MLAAVLTSILLAQAPSKECIEIRNVRALAVKNGYDVTSLQLLEKRYCPASAPKKSNIPAPPASLANVSSVCIEARIVELLGAMDPTKGSPADLAAMRTSSCSSQNTPPELRYNNGRLARSSTGVWSFPSGKLARALGGPWLYPDGKIAGRSGALWNYPDGQTARFSDGTWKSLGGPTTSLQALVQECRQAGACKGPQSPSPGGEDLYAAWLVHELWMARGKK